jgi:hypothetical protein
MPTPATITVPYAEMGEDRGFGGGFDSQGPWINRAYLVEWGDLDTFLVEMRGGTSYSGTFGSGVWIRRLPMQDPNNTTLYADSITWEPEGRLEVPSTPIAYSHAVVKVVFRRPPWDMQASDNLGFANSLTQDPADAAALLYSSQELDYGARWYDIPQSAVTWDSDGTKVNTPIPRRVTTITWNITYHLFPFLPSSIFEQYVDTVNTATFLGRARGTVMFTGPKTMRETNQDGTTVQKVAMAYSWRSIDWNKFLRPDTIRWDVAKDSAGATTYAYTDFQALLDYFS